MINARSQSDCVHLLCAVTEIDHDILSAPLKYLKEVYGYGIINTDEV